MTKVAYLDTYFILAFMLNEEVKRLGAVRLFKSLRRKNHKVIVSRVVVGETITKLLHYQKKMPPSELFDRFLDIFDLLKIDIHNDIQPLYNDTLTLTQGLLKRDDKLHVTDAVIVASALVNPDSRALYTVDKRLVNNPKIIEYERELRDSGKRNVPLVIIGRFLA